MPLVQRLPRAAQLDVLPVERTSPRSLAVGAVRAGGPARSARTRAARPDRPPRRGGSPGRTARSSPCGPAPLAVRKAPPSVRSVASRLVPSSSASSAARSLPIIAEMSLQPRQLGDRVLADELAVAQHRDAVGDLVDLVEEVRDEQHRDALVAHPPDHRRSVPATSDVQGRRGLVQHQDLGLDVDGPARSPPAAGRRWSGRRAATPGRCPGSGSRSTRLASVAHPAEVDQPKPSGLAAEDDVLGDA